MNFVEAREVESPPGTTSVVWRLVATEPIDTPDEIGNVIDIYRKRWVIEEFFKAIKTGCKFESHQLEDARGLLVAQAIESAIAWQILRLRHVARSKPEADGEALLTLEQFETFKRIRSRRGETSRHLTVGEVIDELARLSPEEQRATWTGSSQAAELQAFENG